MPCRDVLCCVVRPSAGMEGEEGVLSEEGQALLHENRELDYMTHWVLRMYENKTLPLEDPKRFKVGWAVCVCVCARSG